MLAKRFFWMFLVLILPFAPAAQSQNSRASLDVNEQLYLRGKVKTPNEIPVAHARVELRRLTGEMIGIVMTGDDGQYSFPMLAAGSYVLSVTCQGFEVVREEVNLHFAELANHSVYLRRNSRHPDIPNTPTVSVRELSLPHKAASAFRKGTEMLYQRQQAEQSIRQFHEAVRHYADYYEAYFQIGVAYTQMKKLDDAVAAFEKSLQLSSHRYAPALVGLAAIASERQKYVEAAGLAQLAVDLDAEMWQAHLELGRAQLGQSQLDAAEKSLDKARARNANFPGLYLLYAHLHIRRDDAHALQADLQQYLKLAPDGPVSERARQMLQELSANIAQSRPAASSSPNKH